MPAVELARLRAQINGLIELFHAPAEFHRALSNLLDQYANRALRPGQAVQPGPLLPSYRVTPLIMRQLELELGRTCQELPDQALEVVEAIWQDDYLEPRLLATTLLGVIPASHGEAVVQKLRAWSQPAVNFRLLDALFRNGASGLRRSNPQLLLDLIEDWLSSTDDQVQIVGMRALVPLVEDPAFTNLPPVFRLLSLFVQNMPSNVQVDIQVVMEMLAQRTPVETAFFFRQVLSLSNKPATARLVRRCMPYFGPEQQAGLRAALQASRIR